MRLDKFWAVSVPDDVSEMEDICFETTLENLLLQMKGGLSPEGLELYDNQSEAMEKATERLEARQILRRLEEDYTVFYVANVPKDVTDEPLEDLIFPMTVLDLLEELEDGAMVFRSKAAAIAALEEMRRGTDVL